MSRARYHTQDPKRSLVVPGDHEETLHYALEHWISCAQNAIKDHGAFYVALSGGSTPRTLYQMLANPLHRDKVDWARVHLFWSDERSAPPSSHESNYHMALESHLLDLVPKAQIHRMVAEHQPDLEKNAHDYEKKIEATLGHHSFDFIMLGMGEDGHVASLFPKTAALEETKRLIAPNYVPQKETWRMTMTFPCINSATNIAIYVIGESKQQRLYEVFFKPLAHLPAQRVGAPSHKALWIADQDAAKLTEKHFA